MKCVDCTHCRQIGRTKGTWRSTGRGEFYCEHPAAPVNEPGKTAPFICHGSVAAPECPTIKTMPKWCPFDKKVEVDTTPCSVCGGVGYYNHEECEVCCGSGMAELHPL